MATRYTSIATAALIAGTVGTSLYTASTAQDAREAISAAHDPTTRHGELVVRVDAGGADVTALAPVDPGTAGQVLTVSDAGLPHWAAASAGGASLPDAAGVSDGAVLVQAGGAQAWVGPPTTLAAQAQLEARSRRGALVAVSAATSNNYSASTTTSATVPMIKRSTSGVAVVYSPQAGGYPANGYLLASGPWPTRGFLLYAVASDIGIYAVGGGGYARTPVVGSIGWHAVAWSISADGATVRVSVDGAAATNATITGGPLTFTNRLAADPVYVLSDGASAGSAGLGVAYIGLWSSILSDGDLVTLSTSPASGAPTLPSSPAWEWAAAAFSGASRVTIAGDTYSTSATAPTVWMP